MGNTYKSPERRGSARVRVEFILSYKVDRPIEVRMRIGNREVDALMLDLSGVGMAILTDYDIPVSSALSVKFTLINLYAKKDERISSIEIMGEVRNNILSKENEHRLGICFTQIAEEDKCAITNFVKMAMNR